MIRVAWDHQIFAANQYGGIARYYAEMAPLIGMEPDLRLRIYALAHINEYLAGAPKPWVVGRRVPRRARIQRLARDLDQRAIRPIVTAARPDVVHETYYAERRSGPKHVPVVLTVYDMIHEKLPQFFPNDPTPRLKAAALDRADIIACISESTRRDLLDLRPELADRTTVTLLGFSRALHAASAGEAVVHPRPYLLFVGWRGAYKNFRGLLDAYAASPELRAGFEIVCAGGGGFGDDERAAIAAAGLEGRVMQRAADDATLHALYRGATAFIYPSLYEGFGIPPLEAMAAGTPVVAMRTSSVPEVCADAAAYAEVGSLESLRSAIEKVAFDDAEADRLRAAGTARVAEFSWERCAAETAAIYRRVAG